MTENQNNSYLETLNMLRRQCLDMQMQSHTQVNNTMGMPGDIVIAYKNILWGYYTFLVARLEGETEKKKIDKKFKETEPLVQKVNNAKSQRPKRKRSKELLKKLDEILTEILKLEAHYDLL